MKILSIDAWAGYEPKTWDWNNWFKVGEISKEEFETLKTEKDYRFWFRNNGYTNTANKKKVTIDDDQYNIVVCNAKTLRPLFAIEYGPEY
jgi:hypothetical protein